MNEIELETGAIDRLEAQRHSLENHLLDLEKQIREAGQHHAAVCEHIRRLREKQNKVREMVH
jgi:phage shock protein A